MTRPGRPAAISPISCDRTPCGNEYASSSFVLDHRAQARLVADVAADRPLVHARESQLRKATVGEIARPDYAHGRQVARVARLLEDGFQFVDELCGQRMAGS